MGLPSTRCSRSIPRERRELTEAKEAQRKAVSELSAARDAQEKVGMVAWEGEVLG